MNSLGINKDPKDTRVVVAMSGGVDSSVTAALLHEQGYDVVGVTLQLYDYGKAVERKGACCAGQDIYDAKRVAEEKGFPHYVLNYEDNFRESVMDDFADSYMKGETPIPCVRCNQTVKFRDLFKVAQDLGADCMATGHYIKRVINEQTGQAELHRAVDGGKDQSYFLFATTQDQLNFLRFPLGAWTKDVTREHAQRLGLLVCDKPDSQDICFVPNGDYASVVKKIRPEAEKHGTIVDMNGAVMGAHQGVIHYTIGQRRGLGIGGGHNDDNSPFYVVKVDPIANQVIVGPKEALARDIITINQCNWLIEIPHDGLDVMVKLRSVSKPSPARLHNNADGTAQIHLQNPQYGIAPGQAGVCYGVDDMDDRVLGGGWIIESQNSSMPIAA
ncbi:MAG: tRNA 2-thiouridine(34) synthase MnmA [Alphaproteobacteria bacterium]|nr:tRNA 2-thiouridine(34) synthase MnmA [Alphaproteobacteria bacterium]NCQ88788.1 tRNA 2-thiouridine(34) synthase MnmA [Alphaproteobacteria bacterium]NCT07289.1 tRNA 2-thiouridine(34) synthase MnmA [Alphaproteobacteria bacterium]